MRRQRLRSSAAFEGGVAAMAQLVRDLEGSAEAYPGLEQADLLDAWCDTVARFRDPESEERRRLDPVLSHNTGLTLAALEAGLDAVLGGVDRPAASRLAREARRLDNGAPPVGLVWIVLAANLPGLVVQPLLPALLCRRVVLIKSSQHEPSFAPSFVEALVEREPRLDSVLAAVSWAGGDEALERPVAQRAERVLAYGGSAAIEDLQRRLGPKLVPFGPKLSIAVVGRDAEPTDIVPGLARDIALFDQRGCLSIQAIYTAGDPETLADALGSALEKRARRWPPGLDSETALAVRQLRDEAIMRGLWVVPLDPTFGTVVIETDPALTPSPGGRTVRIHPLNDLRELPGHLDPWKDQVQGAALVGADAWALEPCLRDLGVSRCVLPGELQSPDALWHNGGLPPLEALAGTLDPRTKTPDPDTSARARLG